MEDPIISNFKISKQQIQYYMNKNASKQQKIINYVKTLPKNNSIYKQFKNVGFIISNSNNDEDFDKILRQKSNKILINYESNKSCCTATNNLFNTPIKKKILLEIKQSINFPENLKIERESLPHIDINGDGNCWYRSISMILTGDDKYFKIIRKISAANLSEEFILQKSIISIKYYIFSDCLKNINNEKCIQIRKLINGSEIYMVKSDQIFSCLNPKTKELLISKIKNTSFFNIPPEELWEFISNDEKHRIKDVIKQFVENFKNPLSRMDESTEIPNILQFIYNKYTLNILLFYFRSYDGLNLPSNINGGKNNPEYKRKKNIFDKYYSGISLFTKNERFIDEKTIFGFAIGLPGHTIVMYEQLFLQNNIPLVMKEILKKIFFSKINNTVNKNYIDSLHLNDQYFLYTSLKEQEEILYKLNHNEKFEEVLRLTQLRNMFNIRKQLIGKSIENKIKIISNNTLLNKNNKNILLHEFQLPQRNNSQNKILQKAQLPQNNNPQNKILQETQLPQRNNSRKINICSCGL